jgi:hypothetical protein
MVGRRIRKVGISCLKWVKITNTRAPIYIRFIISTCSSGGRACDFHSLGPGFDSLCTCIPLFFTKRAFLREKYEILMDELAVMRGVLEHMRNFEQYVVHLYVSSPELAELFKLLVKNDGKIKVKQLRVLVPMDEERLGRPFSFPDVAIFVRPLPGTFFTTILYYLVNSGQYTPIITPVYHVTTMLRDGICIDIVNASTN